MASSHRFIRWVVPAAAALALAAAGQMHHSAAAATSARHPLRAWMLTGSNIARLNRAAPTAAGRLFNSPATYGVGNPAGDQMQVPAGSRATPALSFRSFAIMRADIAAHRIDRRVTTLLYDPEDWAATPVSERRDPVVGMRRFAQLAHAHGYRVILAPGRDLMQVAGGVCGKERGETNDAAYLRCGLAADARYAEVFVIQSQADEFTLGRFRALVAAATAQARAAGGHAVFAEVSTSPLDRVASPAQIEAAVDAVKSRVDGYSLWVSAGSRVQFANTVTAIRRIAGG